MKALIQVAEKGSWKFISFMIHKESEEGISRIFGTFFTHPTMHVSYSSLHGQGHFGLFA
jgi:hypothetical protein